MEDALRVGPWRRRASATARAKRLPFGFCVTGTAVIWMLLSLNGVKATAQSESGPQLPETGPVAETPEERSHGAEAVERIRREINRTLAVLSAESGTDPTAIIGQLSPRTRYQNRDKNQRVQEIARVDLPLARDWILRIDAPFTYLDPKNSNDNSVAGMGDLRARLGWRVVNTDKGSIFIGSEFYFPTASNDQLGANQYKIGPTVVGSLRIPDLKSNAFLWVEYVTAVSGRLGHVFHGGLNTDESSSESVVRLRFNTLWTPEWWTFIESRFFVDWTQNAKTGMVLMFEGGRRLDNHWRLYLRPEVGLWGTGVPGAYNYGVELGVRYMFYVF